MTEVIALNKAEGKEKKPSEFRYDSSSGYLPMFGVGPGDRNRAYGQRDYEST